MPPASKSHLTPSLTHSPSCLTQETKPKIDPAAQKRVWSGWRSSLSFDTREPLANQQPQDLLVFHLWDDLTALFFALTCLSTEICLVFMKKSKRERALETLENSSETYSGQKGRNMTPTIVGFCPWLASVMGLYGLTVTMRIHQLLTIRKISNHLNHLLIIFSCGRILEQQPQKAWIPRMRS